MYFLKNSRCVLRKSHWFSSNVIERNFRLSFVKLRARYPEDDPTKPPLRLNIPKDTPTPCPYNFTPQIQLNSTQNINSENLGTNWLTPDVQLGSSENAVAKDEILRRTKSNRNLDEKRNSSEMLDNLNFSVRSKSSESLKSNSSADKTGIYTSGKVKNFKLKKIRSYEELKPKMEDDMLREYNSEEKNGILTIKISLNDREDEKLVTGISQMETYEDVTSDEQIKALAEAIVNELNPNTENVDPMEAKPSERRDEAFLVIINVMDKDIPDGTAKQPQLSAEAQTQNRELIKSEPLHTSIEDGCYGTQIQVRNLDLRDDVRRNIYKEQLGRSMKMRESDTPTVGSEQILTSLESVMGSRIMLHGELDRHLRQETQYNPNGNISKENRYVKGANEFIKDNEKRKEVFEGTIRRVRAIRSHIPVWKKKQTMDIPKKEVSTPSMGNSHEKFMGSRLQRPIEFIGEFGMRSNTTRGILGEGKRASTAPIIVSKEVTLIDEAHPDYKMLRKNRREIKNMEDDKFKKSSTIRSYHNSCKNLCKLTKGIGEEKLPIVVMNFSEKSGSNCKGDGDNPKEETGKTAPLRLTKEYSNSKLDNSYDVIQKRSKSPDINGSNHIYLQEESVIDNNTQRTEEKTVQKTNHKVECSKKEDDLNDERYELDIADTRTSDNSVGVKVPYSAAYPSNRFFIGDERRRFNTFRDLTSETFEMNVNCLSKDKAAEGDPSNYRSEEDIAESPVESKIENVATKLSDNIVNLANEDLTENKGALSVDSLTMMKQVKEIVDFDLKNAEKIFMGSDIELMDAENKVGENTSEALPEIISPPQLKSAVILNEETNRFYVNTNELEHATNAQKQEIILALDNPKILDLNQEVFKGDLAIYVDVSQELTNPNENYILKNGDSILVYDEESRKWNVDFTLLREKEQTKEQKNEKVSNEKSDIRPLDNLSEKPQKEEESKEGRTLSLTVTSEVTPIMKGPKLQSDTLISENKASELKRKGKKEFGKEVDAKEIRKKNSDLYDDVFIGIKKPNTKENKVEGEVGESQKWTKKADGVEKLPSEHYVSENILEMSKNNTVKPRSNKIETVKLNIAPKERPPSKVTEINLNKKNEDGKSSVKGDSDKGSKDGTKKRDQPNGTFYKKFEKYKTPFSDPEYEEKPMKINSDLKSNPNLKKLDSWNKTLVLQEMGKSPENMEGWLKDETDKMATLLLKVLQDAADGNSRRRAAGKTPWKGNPYETIRKKQENNSSPAKGKKKEPGRKRTVPTQKCGNNDQRPVKAEERKNTGEERSNKGQFPIVEDDSHVEVLASDSHLPKEPFQVPSVPITILNEKLTDDIPGPYLLKKISSIWRYLPDLGCQTTIFLLIRMFHMAKIGLTVFSSQANSSRNDPFGRLFMKYGPVVKLRGPLSGDVVLINRPEDLNSVFAQARATPARSVLDSVENCRVRVRKKNFPMGVTQSCNGSEWDVIRKSMIDVENKGCLQYFSMIKNADAMFVDRIRSIRNNQKQVPDNFINEVKKWSMEGLCGVLFDKSLGFLENKNSQIQWIAESERLMRHLGEATHHLSQCESSFQTWRFINTPAIRGLNQAYQALDLIISKYVYQAELTLRKKKKSIINNKSNANKNLNFLESVLLNDKMAPDEITASLIDVLLIGVNTTTVALSFLLYNLAQNNRAQCLLFKEVNDLLPTKTSTLYYHQLHSLKYLQACLKESLRLCIPIPLLLRVLPNDIALANYRVPYGTHIVMDTQTACMKEQIFDDPERFKPERWLEQDCVHPFASVPFSNSPRACFVKRLAEIQLWTCVAQIVRNYQIEYHFGEIKGSKDVISYPDKPLRLTFVERKD